jgi:hypothetical protein
MKPRLFCISSATTARVRAFFEGKVGQCRGCCACGERWVASILDELVEKLRQTLTTKKCALFEWSGLLKGTGFSPYMNFRSFSVGLQSLRKICAASAFSDSVFILFLDSAYAVCADPANALPNPSGRQPIAGAQRGVSYCATISLVVESLLVLFACSALPLDSHSIPH